MQTTGLPVRVTIEYNLTIAIGIAIGHTDIADIIVIVQVLLQ